MELKKPRSSSEANLMLRSIRLGIPMILLLTLFISIVFVSSRWSVVSFFYQEKNEPKRSELMKTFKG